MKNIFLIEKAPDVFKSVKSYLEESETPYTSFNSLADVLQSDVVPALIILFSTDSYEEIEHDIALLKSSASFSKISRVLVLPFNTSVFELKAKDLDIQALFHIPVDKPKFLTSIAQLLRRAPRRIFRILITLQTEGSNLRYSGVSIDFGESGMAFECSADFHPDELLHVQFVNPRSRKRFSLKSMVIRRVDTGSTIFYGLKFIEMSPQDMKDLLDFISGEK